MPSCPKVIFIHYKIYGRNAESCMYYSIIYISHVSIYIYYTIDAHFSVQPKALNLYILSRRFFHILTALRLYIVQGCASAIYRSCDFRLPGQIETLRRIYKTVTRERLQMLLYQSTLNFDSLE